MTLSDAITIARKVLDNQRGGKNEVTTLEVLEAYRTLAEFHPNVDGDNVKVIFRWR